MDVKWRLVVRPVTVMFIGASRLPFEIVQRLQLYTDELPNDEDAKLAYRQYMAGEK
jgi:hypothetical protein